MNPEMHAEHLLSTPMVKESVSIGVNRSLFAAACKANVAVRVLIVSRGPFAHLPLAFGVRCFFRGGRLRYVLIDIA